MFFASPSNDLYEGHDSSFLPCIGCWGVSCPMYSEFLIDTTAPRGKWRSKRKGKVPLLPSVFHNCPRPPPVCGLPLLCSVSEFSLSAESTLPRPGPLVGNHLLLQRPKKKIPPTGHPWSRPRLAALELVRDGLWRFPLPCYREPGSLEEIVLCPQTAASGGVSWGNWGSENWNGLARVTQAATVENPSPRRNVSWARFGLILIHC